MATVPVVDELLLESLRKHEGRRLRPYKDTEGFWTLGYGRKINAHDAETFRAGITRETAESWLKRDAQVHADELTRALPWISELDPVRWRVLVEMAFNLGVPGLLRFTQTLGAVKSGRYELAARLMLQSLWAAQVGNRARVLSRRMRTGQWEVE